jgi:hypothetical protein
MAEGDVTKKFRAEPKVKPPRRQPAVDNKSHRTDYMKNYMKEYRDEGKDYQKIPEKIKELHKKQKKEHKEKKMSGNIGIGVDHPVRELCITEPLNLTLS